MTRVVLIAVVVLLVGAANCGGHSGTSADVSAALLNEIGQVRTAANAHDVATATARLDDIRRSVITLRAGGQLSAATAARIVTATDAVQSNLALIATPSSSVSTSTSTSTTTVSTTTTKPPPAGPPDKGHGKKGHGDGHD